jgi:microcystin-dependent protein
LKTKGIKRPIGSIQMYAGDKVPDLPWLICNGSSISRSDFPKLFAIIGTIYGSGDGKTTFNLPDLQARIPMGANAYNQVGQAGGKNSHSLSIHELPSHYHGVGNLEVKNGGQHSHSISDPGHDHGGRTGYSNYAGYPQSI